MRTDSRSTGTPTLGDVVVAAYDSGRAVASDRDSAAELAARYVERVLLREHNTRLLVALVQLAREVGPANDTAPVGPERRHAHARRAAH